MTDLKSTEGHQHIFDRIMGSFRKDEFSINYYNLAARVFPKSEYPNAWRYSRNGGPPGCYMALSSALRRYGFYQFTNRHGHRMISRTADNPPTTRARGEE